MAETLPIVEQIAAKVLAAVQAVTTGGGYQVTLTASRPIKTGMAVAPKDKDAYILQDAPSRVPELDYPGNPARIAWRQPFSVDIILLPAEGNAVAIDKLINWAMADVQKALMAKPQWDGLAINTELADPIYHHQAADGYDGAVVRADVIYRVKETDPYAQ